MLDNIILASNSPRRKDLLESAGVSFEIITSEVDETINYDLAFEDIVVDIALRKAHAVFNMHPDRTILSCDTLVFTENEVLEKPKDEKDAFNMLKKLSGITHQVISGVCIVHEGRIITFFEITDVTFKYLSDDDILEYIQTGESLGKSGSYAIQGIAAKFVEKVEGSIDNVIGLPLAMVLQILEELDR